MTERTDDTQTIAAANMQSRSRLARAFVGAVTIAWRDLAALRDLPWLLATMLPATAFLLAFDSGFSTFFGRPLLEPYNAYVELSDYLVPGLVVFVAVLSVARSVVSMLRWSGLTAIRPLVGTPLPLWAIVVAKLAGAAAIATVRALVFLAVVWLVATDLPPGAWLAAIPAIFSGAYMLGGVLFVLTALVRPLRHLGLLVLAVLLPAFSLSSALYPLWQFADADSYLSAIADANPLTHAAELIRYASEGQTGTTSLAVVIGLAIVVSVAAMVILDPRRRLLSWRRIRHPQTSDLA